MSDTYEIECVGKDKLSGMLRNIAQSCDSLNSAAKNVAQGITTANSAMESSAKSGASTAGWLKFGVVLSTTTKLLGLAKRAADAMGRNVATEGLYEMDIRLRSIASSLADMQSNMSVATQLRDIKFSKAQSDVGASGGSRTLEQDITDSDKAIEVYNKHLEQTKEELAKVQTKWTEAYDQIAKTAENLVDKLPSGVKSKLGDLTTALAGLGVPISDALHALGGKETLETLDQERSKLIGLKDQLEALNRAESARNQTLRAQNDAVYMQNIRFKEQVERAGKLAALQRAGEEATRRAADVQTRSGGRATAWSVPGQRGSQAEGREARREDLAQSILAMDPDKREKWYNQLLRSHATSLSQRDSEALSIMGTFKQTDLTAGIRKGATATEYSEYLRKVNESEQKRGEDALEKLATFLLDQLSQK